MQKNISAKSSVPEWMRKGSIYQINPRTFSNEGTIASITKEIPFLADLGFKVIYLCPIFKEDDALENRSPRQLASETENPKNPYRIVDHFEIDSEYGNLQDLKDLVKKAHTFDLKVMLDLVYLHVGCNADMIKQYPDFVQRDEEGNIKTTLWNFPILNFESEGLREFLWCNMAYYVSAIGVDGFRCDAADHTPLDFWTEGNRRIRAIKPDAVFLYEGAKPEAFEKGFDMSYCFPWHEALYFTVRDGAPASDIRKAHETVHREAPDGSVFIRNLDTHDTVTDWPERMETVAGHNGMEQILVLNHVIDGVPMIYCGNELADSTALNMFSNRFFRGRFQATDRDAIKNEGYSLRRQEIIRRLSTFKAQSDTLCYGETAWIDNSCNERVISFERRHGGEKIVFIGNLSKDACTARVDLPGIENGEILFQSEAEPIFSSDEGLRLPPYGYAVIRL